jgi:hypothetical protein
MDQAFLFGGLLLADMTAIILNLQEANSLGYGVFLVPYSPPHDNSENSVLNLLDTVTSIVQQAAWKRLVLTKGCLNALSEQLKVTNCRAIETASNYLNRVTNYQN